MHPVNFSDGLRQDATETGAVMASDRQTDGQTDRQTDGQMDGQDATAQATSSAACPSLL
jgi:hypothetical protein